MADSMYPIEPSGFVQSMIAELIMGPHDPKHGRGGGNADRGWQTDGWVRWLEGLRGNYQRRMQTMCSILDEGKDLVKAGRRKSISDEWSVVDKGPPLRLRLAPRRHVRLDPHELRIAPSLEKDHAAEAGTGPLDPSNHAQVPRARGARRALCSDRSDQGGEELGVLPDMLRRGRRTRGGEDESSVRGRRAALLEDQEFGGH